MTVNSRHKKAAAPYLARLPKARKSLGQNFLKDENVRDAILEAARLSKDDVVIEVGPGAGILTEGLAAGAGKVVAIELDAKLAVRLQHKLVNLSNLTIRLGDILQERIRDLVDTSHSYKVVANIPYYITSPILHYFAHHQDKPALMVIMIQKEVAREVIGTQGRLSYLAVAMQLYYSVELICAVPASSFHPVPRVDSAVLRFQLLPQPAVKLDNLDDFIATVHAGFAAPRKQLHNSLAVGLKFDTSPVQQILSQAGIDSARRAETLSLTEWGNLHSAIMQHRKRD